MPDVLEHGNECAERYGEDRSADQQGLVAYPHPYLPGTELSSAWERAHLPLSAGWKVALTRQWPDFRLDWAQLASKAGT